MKVPKGKLAFLIGMVLFYILFGLSAWLLVEAGVIARLPPTPIEETGIDSAEIDYSEIPNLRAAQEFVNEKLSERGHVKLYYVPEGEFEGSERTNSEAVTYYLLWNAREGNKNDFDSELDFIENEMMHTRGFLQWRIEESGKIVGDGQNIASDADLRMIRALMIAEKRWGDERYTELIDQVSEGLEDVAVTNDNYLAPYGGVSGESPWTADEVWLSYTNFEVFRELAERRGEPWKSIYSNMKGAVLAAQLDSGLYNSRLDNNRDIYNLDEDRYSINSLWIMVRNSESGDKELVDSARKSIEVYKKSYRDYGELFTEYDGGGRPVSSESSPWVYALVGRAAVNLGEEEFAKEMLAELKESQVLDEDSNLYGSFPEGDENSQRAGQFTIQEAILTIQDFIYGES